MMTLNDVEQRQAEILKKVQMLFENKKRTQKDMDELYDEISRFEKERVSFLCKELDIEGEGEHNV